VIDVGNPPTPTHHTDGTHQHQTQLLTSSPTSHQYHTQEPTSSTAAPPTPKIQTPQPAQAHAGYSDASKNSNGSNRTRITGTDNRLWTPRSAQTYRLARTPAPSGTYRTSPLFIKNCYILNRTTKLNLYQKLYVICSFILTRINIRKTSLTFSPPTVVVAQKQFQEPHKALHLTGGGRGKRKSPAQHNQYHLHKIAKTKQTKQHKLNNTTYSSTYCSLYCSCCILLLQDPSNHMAASGSRRVVRALMEEEEELMDIDSAQGSTQKRSNGKVKETTEAHSKKKSKGVEIAVVTIP
jgi:hypothetical protein